MHLIWIVGPWLRRVTQMAPSSYHFCRDIARCLSSHLGEDLTDVSINECISSMIYIYILYYIYTILYYILYYTLYYILYYIIYYIYALPSVIKHGNSTITCKWCTAKLIYKRWIVHCHVWLLKHRILKYLYMPSQKTTGTYRTYRFSRPPFRPVNQQRSRLQRRRRQGESGRSHGHRVVGVGIF